MRSRLDTPTFSLSALAGRLLLALFGLVLVPLAAVAVWAWSERRAAALRRRLYAASASVNARAVSSRASAESFSPVALTT